MSSPRLMPNAPQSALLLLELRALGAEIERMAVAVVQLLDDDRGFTLLAVVT